jgi:uncharacterized protein YlaI
MLEHSVFIADCLCGRQFESPTREYVCPECHRHIVLEWGQHAESEKPDAQPSASEAA